MAGALVLGLMKSNQVSESKYLTKIKPVIAQEAPEVSGTPLDSQEADSAKSE